MLSTKNCLVLLALTTVLSAANALHAQPDEETNAGQGQEQQGQEEQNEQQEDISEEQAQSDLPDIDSQPIDASARQGAGRFIPSEQISQDSGVSFPVDI